MEENLITKKELLELTGISYGSLYRWKRKRLLPDEWFIHRATFTGQETFFPREKVLERVEQILRLKDTLSLDEIADTFSEHRHPAELSLREAVELGLCDRATADLFLTLTGAQEPLDYEGLFQLYSLSVLVRSGELGREEMASALKLIAGSVAISGDLELVVLRKLGIGVCLLCRDDESFLCEEGTRVVLRGKLSRWSFELKEILNRGVQHG